MADINLMDRDLSRAAEKVVSALVDSLPDADSCEHAFSPKFEREMNDLIRKEKRVSVFHAVRRFAVAAILVLVVGVSTWLAVSPTARAEVAQWIRTVYENSVIYRFFGETPDEELPSCRLEWVPEGFQETQLLRTETECALVYENNRNHAVFTLAYFWLDDSGALMIDEETEIQVSVNGHRGYYYPSDVSDSASMLMWVDEGVGIVFVLSAALPEHDIMHIAESVKLDNVPK